MVLTPVLALAGCGSSHMNLSSPTTTRASATTSTTVSATADNGQEPAILAAYRGSLADFNQVATTSPLNPNSPSLSSHMTGNQLATVQKSLSVLKEKDQIDRGQIVSIRESVNQFNGTQAVVVACEKDGISVVDARSHRTVTPATNTLETINALLTLSDGAWKVAQHNQVSERC